MASRKLRCMCLGETSEIIKEMMGDWLRIHDTTDDFVSYDCNGVSIDMYLYWPDCDRQIPRPLDLLLIFVNDDS